MIIICTENEKKALEKIINVYSKTTASDEECDLCDCSDCPLLPNCMEIDSEKVYFKIVENKVV